MSAAIPAVAATAAAAAAGAGEWLFSYNRDNYQFDASNRFSRFMAARKFALAQMGQYRQDVKSLIGSTVMKMDTAQGVLTLFMCTCAALSCAGRIGMHGAAPPQWFCALYSGHIFSALLFNGVGLFLTMHGSLRAQVAMVSLLTRKIRLPIPSISQLDQARVFASGFEKQNVRDIFRVPFMRHTESAPQIPEGFEDEDDDAPKGAGINPQKEFASTARDTIPAWIRDEQVVDKGNGQAGNGAAKHFDHEVPEHFKLILKAQEEYWQYDVYARIMMLFGVCQYLHAVTYYSIGTSIAELRGFWIMWSMPMMFMTAQALIFRLDIVQGNAGQHYLPHAEWAGHIAPYIVCSAFTVEYRLWYTAAGVTTTWALVFGAYAAHIVMSLRMLDCAWPDWDRKDELPDEPGQAWWPLHWKIPSAFSKTIWLIAPPKKLEPGQHDLIREMEGLAQSGGGITSCRRRRKGLGDKTDSKAPKTTSPHVLGAHTDRIDRQFQWWFDESVWPQVPEMGQARLHELFSRFRTVGREVNDAMNQYGVDGEWSAGMGPGPQLSLQQVEKKVAELYGGLMDVSDNLADIEETYKSAMTANFPAGEEVSQSPTVVNGRPHLPWQMVRFAIGSVIFMWTYMIIMLIIEASVGIENIMKWPGEPPWIRDTKIRSWDPSSVHFSDQALPLNYNLWTSGNAIYLGNSSGYVPKGHSGVASGVVTSITGFAPNTFSNSTSNQSFVSTDTDSLVSLGGHRRLSKNLNSDEMALESLLKALPELDWLAEAVTNAEKAPLQKQQAAAPSSFMAVAPRPASIAWPALFEPQHLSCTTGMVAALTRRGLGALAQMSGQPSTAEQFTLEGLGEHGRLAGSSWVKSGLQLATSAGAILECPGQGPTDGVWACQKQGALPLPAGAKLMEAALNFEHPLGRLAALQLDIALGTIAIFEETDVHGWRPAGEVHMPPAVQGRVSLSFQGPELFVSTITGEVHRRHLVDGTSAWHMAPAGLARREFQSACELPAVGLVRLALRKASTELGAAWGPELLVGPFGNVF